MNDNQNTVIFSAAFWMLGILAVVLGALPFSYFVTLNVSNFEGGRGYALVSLIPIIGIALLISVTALFFIIRRNQKLHDPVLLGLLVFNLLVGVSYFFIEGLFN